MKISIIGTGYVGTVTGVCLAEMGHQIHFVDIDQTETECNKFRKKSYF